MATRNRTNRKHNDHAYRALRKEKSRECAERRRRSQKTVMSDLTSLLPFPPDVISTLDYSSLLRLVLCYFRLKSLLGETQPAALMNGDSDNDDSEHTTSLSSPLEGGGEVAAVKDDPHRGSELVLHHKGMMQDMFIEALDGLIMVLQLDGTILYISETMLKHLGLFQSEHIGSSIYTLLHADDQLTVKDSLSKAEKGAEKSPHCTSKVGFFCRIRCSRFKVTNTNVMAPGYKLVYVSGTLKVRGSEPYVVCLVQPVSPPSVLEVRMEGNMFVTHHTMEMKCSYYDGRLWHLLGYKKSDFLGTVPFTRHHHDDIESTLECGKEVMQKGEAMSGYYRMLTKYGHYIWLQTRATVMKGGRSGAPSYVICMNYIISKDDGERFLAERMSTALSAATTGRPSSSKLALPISHDPFPVNSCGEDKMLNPLKEEQDFDCVEVSSSVTSTVDSTTPESFTPSSLDTTMSFLDTTTPAGLETTATFLDSTSPCLDTVTSMNTTHVTTQALHTTTSFLDTSPPFLDTTVSFLDTTTDPVSSTLETTCTLDSTMSAPQMDFLDSLLQPDTPLSTRSELMPSLSPNSPANLSPSPASSLTSSPRSVLSNPASVGYVSSQHVQPLSHDIRGAPLSHGMLPVSHDLLQVSHDTLMTSQRPLQASHGVQLHSYGGSHDTLLLSHDIVSLSHDIETSRVNVNNPTATSCLNGTHSQLNTHTHSPLSTGQAIGGAHTRNGGHLASNVSSTNGVFGSSNPVTPPYSYLPSSSHSHSSAQFSPSQSTSPFLPPVYSTETLQRFSSWNNGHRVVTSKSMSSDYSQKSQCVTTKVQQSA